MGAKSAIGWTGATWTPITGCTRVSAGCDHCYAFALHDARHVAWKRGRYDSAAAQYHQPFSAVQLLDAHLTQPLRWRAPRRIFVSSMGDLFHEAVPDAYLDKVFAVMALADRHTFQVLTKRPERMHRYLTTDAARVWAVAAEMLPYQMVDGVAPMVSAMQWPLPNVWIGTSVENQEQADKRIPWLMETPAALRFLSCEPLLGPVDLRKLHSGWEGPNGEHWYVPREVYPLIATMAIPDCDIDSGGIGWVIVGGESGPHYRPMQIDWLRRLVKDCKADHVPVYVKQGSARRPGQRAAIPEDLWLHEFPEPAVRAALAPAPVLTRAGGYPT